jgi:hypothetical protein
MLTVLFDVPDSKLHHYQEIRESLSRVPNERPTVAGLLSG